MNLVGNIEYLDLKDKLNDTQIESILLAQKSPVSATKLKSLCKKHKADPNFYAWGARMNTQVLMLLIFYLINNHEADIEFIGPFDISASYNIAASLIHHIRDHFHLSKMTARVNKKVMPLFYKNGFNIYRAPNMRHYNCIWEKSLAKKT